MFPFKNIYTCDYKLLHHTKHLRKRQLKIHSGIEKLKIEKVRQKEI